MGSEADAHGAGPQKADPPKGTPLGPQGYRTFDSKHEQIRIEAGTNIPLPTGIKSAGGPQGKSEDQPHAKQIAPAEGVTPPLTHGSRVSFAHTPVSILGWIYDPDHSLPPGMYVDVPHLDCLLVAAPITLEGLDRAPGDIPPCIRQRPFGIAADRQPLPLLVRAPHRRLRCMLAPPCIRHLARPVTAACLQG